MNEEEKKAIEELEEFIKGPCETCKYCEAAYKLNRKNIIQLLNLTKKLQKENERNLIVREEIKQIADNLYYNNYKGNFADGEFAREMAIKLKEILEREE